jgi:hypothetical protein
MRSSGALNCTGTVSGIKQHSSEPYYKQETIVFTRKCMENGTM